GVAAGAGPVMGCSPHSSDETGGAADESAFGQKAVLDREQTCRDAVLRVDLAVDVLDVVCRRLRGNDELLGDVFRRKAASEQPQASSLPSSQSRRALAPQPGAVAGDTEHGFDDVVVEFSRPSFITRDAGRLFGGVRATMRTRFEESLIHVGG